jgi:predicted TPR repeat methyltransferase
VQHAKTFVKQAIKRLGLSDESLVIEVASNDGYLPQNVVAAGIPWLGIKPSVNVGATARERGVPTVTGFLDESLARRVGEEHGPVDLIVANNVYAHIPDLRGFTRSLRTLLADDGWLSIEVHHALPLVRHAQFDTIYHEHFQHYTLLSATRALATAGLAVVDVELLATHGGSLRIWARPSRIAAPPSEQVVDVLRMEKAAELHRVDGYLQLRYRTEMLRHSCARLVRHHA